jgi:hypothetical protein
MGVVWLAHPSIEKVAREALSPDCCGMRISSLDKFSPGFQSRSVYPA